jgi:hypothetical protein
MSEGNGQSDLPVDHLIISVTFNPFHVHVAGRIESDALALAVLRQAVDLYEARIRAAHAQQLMQQMAQARRDQVVIESLNKR